MKGPVFVTSSRLRRLLASLGSAWRRESGVSFATGTNGGCLQERRQHVASPEVQPPGGLRHPSDGGGVVEDDFFEFIPATSSRTFPDCRLVKHMMHSSNK